MKEKIYNFKQYKSTRARLEIPIVTIRPSCICFNKNAAQYFRHAKHAELGFDEVNKAIAIYPTNEERIGCFKILKNEKNSNYIIACRKFINDKLELADNFKVQKFAGFWNEKIRCLIFDLK